MSVIHTHWHLAKPHQLILFLLCPAKSLPVLLDQIPTCFGPWKTIRRVRHSKNFRHSRNEFQNFARTSNCAPRRKAAPTKWIDAARFIYLDLSMWKPNKNLENVYNELVVKHGTARTLCSARIKSNKKFNFVS